MDVVDKILIEICVKKNFNINLMHLENASMLLDTRKRSTNRYTRDAAKAIERVILATMKLKLKKEI